MENEKALFMAIYDEGHPTRSAYEMPGELKMKASVEPKTWPWQQGVRLRSIGRSRYR